MRHICEQDRFVEPEPEPDSCIPRVHGCTNHTMSNFNSSANTDNGTCIPKMYGCLEYDALNFDPEANTDDGNCADPRTVSVGFLMGTFADEVSFAVADPFDTLILQKSGPTGSSRFQDNTNYSFSAEVSAGLYTFFAQNHAGLYGWSGTIVTISRPDGR